MPQISHRLRRRSPYRILDRRNLRCLSGCAGNGLLAGLVTFPRREFQTAHPPGCHRVPTLSGARDIESRASATTRSCETRSCATRLIGTRLGGTPGRRPEHSLPTRTRGHQRRAKRERAIPPHGRRESSTGGAALTAPRTNEREKRAGSDRHGEALASRAASDSSGIYRALSFADHKLAPG